MAPSQSQIWFQLKNQKVTALVFIVQLQQTKKNRYDDKNNGKKAKNII